MTRDQLIDIIQKLLKAEADLSFLQKLETSELETLVACVRAGLEKSG